MTRVQSCTPSAAVFPRTGAHTGCGRAAGRSGAQAQHGGRGGEQGSLGQPRQAQAQAGARRGLGRARQGRGPAVAARAHEVQLRLPRARLLRAGAPDLARVESG